MIAEKFIRILRLNSEPAERGDRKILQICRHNYIATSDNRGGENMMIIRVRQISDGIRLS
jgi:hypothetical protein